MAYCMNHKSHQYDNDEAQIQAIVLQNTTGGKLLAGPIAPGDTIPLGRCGENLAIKVVFDVSKLIESYGQGTFAIIAQRSVDDAPYPCEFTVSGTNVIWVITAADVDMPGEYGSCEIRYYSNDVLVKSRTWKTWADFSLGDSSASPPEASQGWVDQVLEAGLSAKASAASAASSAEAAIASQQSASASEGDAAHSASVAVGAHDAAESAKEAAEAAQKAAAKSESAAKLAEKNAKASESAAGSATASAWNASSAAQTAQRNAEAAQSAAEQSATEAGNANAGAVTAQGKAEDAQRGAEDAKTKAEASKAASANSESAAKLSEQNAKASEDAAKASETASAGSASAAAHSATAAQSAQSGAEAAQSAAAQSAQQAAESAAVYDNVVTDVTQLKADLSTLETRLKSGLIADSELHLGFYLDADGDLCQKED